MTEQHAIQTTYATLRAATGYPEGGILGDPQAGIIESLRTGAMGGRDPPGGSREDGRSPHSRRRDRTHVEIQRQVLTRPATIVGTPFTLWYRSDRTPGRRAAERIVVPLSGATVPNGLERIVLEITVAGHQYVRTFPPEPDQEYTVTQDELDVTDPWTGTRPVGVRVGYVYDTRALARSGDLFDRTADLLGTDHHVDEEVTRWQAWDASIGGWNAAAQGLGGWTLDVHHAYDWTAQAVYPGSGSRRRVAPLPPVVTAVAGSDSEGPDDRGERTTSGEERPPRDVACGPDGRPYVADTGVHRILRVDDEGVSTVVAGVGDSGYGGDEGRATDATLDGPAGVDVAADGSVYVSDTGNDRVRRVSPAGTISTVAGTGDRGYDGDGGPGTDATLDRPQGLAVAADGSIAFVDGGNGCVRQIGADGVITTLVGGESEPSATRGREWRHLDEPVDVDYGPDGTLYVLDGGADAVWRIGRDGVVESVTGGVDSGDDGDVGSASDTTLHDPRGLAVDSTGNAYVTEPAAGRIQRLAPSGHTALLFDAERTGGELFVRADLRQPWNLTTAPDGSVYVTDRSASHLRRLRSPITDCSVDAAVVAAEDGGRLFVFDWRGHHRRTVDALTGAVVYEFAYTEHGHLKTIRDADGNVTTIEREADGDVAVVSPTGQRTTLRTSEGYVEAIVNPAGETTRVTYDDDGLLQTVTDPNDDTTRFTYDDDGQLVTRENPGGAQLDLVRNRTEDGSEVTVVTPALREATTTVERTHTGERRQVNACCGSETVSVRTAGGSHRLTYSDGMRAEVETRPDPRFGTQTWYVDGGVFESPGGITATASIDRSVTLGDADRPLGLEAVTDTVRIGDRTRTRSYGADAQLVTSRSPEGRTITRAIDDRGRLIETRVDGLAPVRRSYDADGHLVRVTTGTGTDARTTAFGYDDGFLETVVDPLGNATRFERDATGRVTTKTLPHGGSVSFTYDANGNVTAIEPPGRPAHDFTYTSTNDREEHVPPSDDGANRTRYAYDDDGQLLSVTLSDERVLTYEYDGAGHLVARTSPRGRTDYEYDPETSLVTAIATSEGGRLSYTYDGGVITGIDWDGAVTGNTHWSYENENGFLVAARRVNDGARVSFEYDSDDLLIRAGELTISRDDRHGRIVGTELGTVSDTWHYNEFGELAAYRVTVGGDERYAVEYTYDAAGRVVEKIETVDGRSDTDKYAYDAIGRLTAVTRNGATRSTYAYDDNGNRTQCSNGDRTVEGRYDDQDRLRRYGNARYTYTPEGTLAEKQVGDDVTTYRYDVVGNLTAVSLPDGSQIEYLVDGSDRRIGTRVDGTVTRGLLYKDPLNPIAELDGSGDVVGRFVYGTRDTVPDYVNKTDGTYRIVSDHLGSPRLVVDVETGEIRQQMAYDAFGTVIEDTNPGFQPFGFAGGLYDAHTGLTRFGARDYDPEVGRWTAKDPIGFDGGDANLYAYVGNNPTTFADPSGLQEGGSSGSCDESGGEKGAIRRFLEGVLCALDPSRVGCVVATTDKETLRETGDAAAELGRRSRGGAGCGPGGRTACERIEEMFER